MSIESEEIFTYISMPNNIGIFGIPKIKAELNEEYATITIKTNQSTFIIVMDINGMIQLKNSLISANDLYIKNFKSKE